MTGITPDVLAKLQAPFAVGDHEFRDGGKDGKMVYITEEPLIDRLTEVDPNWQFFITSTIVTDFNMTRPDCVVVTANLTICGIIRSGTGSAIANVQKYSDGKRLSTPIIYPLSDKELKGAATDALKRCARQFGVGGYLLRLKGVLINNEADFARWYAREFSAPQPPERRQKPVSTPPARDQQPSRKSTPSAPKQATSATVDDGNGNYPDPRDDGHVDSELPTIRDYWPSVASSLMSMKVSDLPEGLNLGGIIYPAAERMGYPSSDAVKQMLGLDSIKDWPNTLEQLMVCILDHAAEFAD